MLNVWIERIPGIPVIPLLTPNLGKEGQGRQLFQNAFCDFHDPLVTIVQRPEEADVLLLAHNFPLVANRRAYLDQYAELSRHLNKRIVVFWHGDGTGPVSLPNARVFRTSQYLSQLRPQDVMMPAYAEDLARSVPLELRIKGGRLPVVGFCGWAEFKNLKNAIGTFLQALPWRMLAGLAGQVHWESRIKGLRLRRRAIAVLAASTCVSPNIVLRSSHSAHAATIRLDPDIARRAYVENMRTSDFTLCIRGDGNYSLRFFEALSMGRVPILIDTDCALPLDRLIDYSAFILRVSLADIAHIDQVVSDFWQHCSADRFMAMQHKAREVFEQHLSAVSFLRYATKHLFL